MGPRYVSTPPPPRRTGHRAALLTLAVVIVAVPLLLVVAALTPSGDVAIVARSPQNLTMPRPEQTAPPSAVRPVHRALHALGRLCASEKRTGQAQLAQPPVTVIIAFARRYPNVSFPIHAETGTTLSLLFVARDSVRSCAPSLAARVERLIPSEYLAPDGNR